MAADKDKEAFIPYRRADIIELCLENGRLSDSDAQQFRDFCHLLSAYYHFKFYAFLERIKDNYAPFNPDTTTRLKASNSEHLEDMEAQLVDDFSTVLERANYIPISPKSLKKAIKESSLIELKTNVDFNDFDRLVCYYRGHIDKTIQIKKLYFWKQKKKIEVFERVALLIKFKNKNYFLGQKKKSGVLKFAPGKMYVYFYKNIPKYDLELLFPNIQISMTLKDRLLLVIPAIGAAVPMIIRALPKLLVIVGAILFFTMGTTEILGSKVEEDQIRDFLPVLTALLSLTVVLGGFAYKQYSKYKSKQIKFRKNVTDTLFFKNLANNTSVFSRIIDLAEEEETKEMILVYYHLLASKEPLTDSQIDRQIETWMDEKLGTKINFDINGPINNLQEIRGVIKEKGQVPLLKKDSQGKCQVLPLDEAKALIDYVWDNIFLYTCG